MKELELGEVVYKRDMTEPLMLGRIVDMLPPYLWEEFGDVTVQWYNLKYTSEYRCGLRRVIELVTWLEGFHLLRDS